MECISSATMQLLSRQGIPISHIFFADDLLLLAEASLDQAEVIMEVLDTFCGSSGEKVSKNKTLTFSPIMCTLAMPNELEPTWVHHYKGPWHLSRHASTHKRITKYTYQTIIDWVQQKLSGWSAKHLSLAGRITLTQSVIQSLPSTLCKP